MRVSLAHQTVPQAKDLEIKARFPNPTDKSALSFSPFHPHPPCERTGFRTEPYSYGQ
jgi:hypothetical protein